MVGKYLLSLMIGIFVIACAQTAAPPHEAVRPEPVPEKREYVPPAGYKIILNEPLWIAAPSDWMYINLATKNVASYKTEIKTVRLSIVAAPFTGTMKEFAGNVLSSLVADGLEIKQTDIMTVDERMVLKLELSDDERVVLAYVTVTRGAGIMMACVGNVPYESKSVYEQCQKVLLTWQFKKTHD